MFQGRVFMSIRRATLADAEILAELNRDVQQLHADTKPGIFKPPTDLSPIICDFQTRILVNPNGRVWLAEREGEALGYVYAEHIQRSENAYVYERSYVHIDQISVRPAYQHSGCGRALIRAVFDWAQTSGVKNVSLDAYAFNEKAQAFFREMGFETLHIRMSAQLPIKDGK
jgi:ribosomal protein S18 acetylase RimI-like enzyme